MPNLYRILWGQPEEVRTNSRYFYDNARRDGESTMQCLQRTRSGRAFFQIGDSRQYVPTGWAMAFGHDENSSYGYPPEDTEPYVHSFLTFEGPDAAELLHRIREQNRGLIPMPKGTESTRLFTECISRFNERSFRDRYQESAKVYELLMVLYSESLSARLDRDPVRSAHEFITGSFGRPITIADVASACGLSREHLSRAYAERYKHSPGRALRELRIGSARELLVNTHVAVEQIAVRCGYRDVDAFARAFARDTGLKPLAYRKRRRGDGGAEAEAV